MNAQPDMKATHDTWLTASFAIYDSMSTVGVYVNWFENLLFKWNLLKNPRNDTNLPQKIKIFELKIWVTYVWFLIRGSFPRVLYGIVMDSFLTK